MNQELAGQLIGLLFLSRDVAHRAHLKARGLGSDAAHEALGAFYDGIVDIADEVAELVQGEYEVLLDIPFVDPEEVFTTNNIYEDARLALKKHKVWIKDNRYSVIPSEETSIHNVIDGAVALYQRLNYKLFDLK